MTALIWYPPEYPAKPAPREVSVFLAGTIDNGKSIDWQARAIELLSPVVDHIYNPRRPDWDASWPQREDNPQFNAQVTWELEHIERADIVLMYLAPGSLSPISLLELGLVAASTPEKLMLCCAEDFWRKGNVDIVSSRQGVRRYANLDLLMEAVQVRAAGMRDKMSLKTLMDIATGKLTHIYNGLCPDAVEGHTTRDPDCPACRAIMVADGVC